MDGGTLHNFGSRVKAVREERGLSMEELAEFAGLHRTAIGLIERGERDPTLNTALGIAKALGVPIQELVMNRPRRRATGVSVEEPGIRGLTGESIRRAIEKTYVVLDTIDAEMVERGYPRLAAAMELANLSAFVGNLFGAATAETSNGIWVRNGPHKYPDLISAAARHVAGNAAAVTEEGVEIKMAMEDNRPKGHLAKSGPHLTVRWVLGHSHGKGWARHDRGDSVVIWEVKAGPLNAETDFRVSNTEGDSGKTAVVKNEPFKRMKLVYFDRAHCPLARVERYLGEHGPRQTPETTRDEAGNAATRRGPRRSGRTSR